MKITYLLLAMLCYAKYTSAQVGIVLGPYFWTPNYGAPLYGDNHNKIQNNIMGGLLQVNINKKLILTISHSQLLSELEKPLSVPKLGSYGATLGYDYLSYKNTEAGLGWFLKNNGKFGFRAGGMLSQRMVQLAPHQVNFTYKKGYTPTAAFDYISPYNVAGIRQQIAFAGFQINKYVKREPIGAVTRFVDWTGVTWLKADLNSKGGISSTRNRVWLGYLDLLMGVKQWYGNHSEHLYAQDTFHYTNADVKNINSLGWRIGAKRLAYNYLGTAFMVEVGKYPGQRRNPSYSPTLDIDVEDNIWKNCFITIGFHITIGTWAGKFEGDD